ncbi:hypothetical protein HU200_018010 [Digitaria exilis]|uniref:Uncharacterized protein n=1 Tax=Digitaria exilis TaxID=1010633 RepID=A0A835F5L7_9POAL|nr:hypothetical protein HU200_018010 [Digitaria exilis]
MYAWLGAWAWAAGLRTYRIGWAAHVKGPPLLTASIRHASVRPQLSASLSPEDHTGGRDESPSPAGVEHAQGAGAPENSIRASVGPAAARGQEYRLQLGPRRRLPFLLCLLPAWAPWPRRLAWARRHGQEDRLASVLRPHGLPRTPPVHVSAYCPVVQTREEAVDCPAVHIASTRLHVSTPLTNRRAASRHSCSVQCPGVSYCSARLFSGSPCLIIGPSDRFGSEEQPVKSKSDHQTRRDKNPPFPNPNHTDERAAALRAEWRRRRRRGRAPTSLMYSFAQVRASFSLRLRWREGTRGERGRRWLPPRLDLEQMGMPSVPIALSFGQLRGKRSVEEGWFGLGERTRAACPCALLGWGACSAFGWAGDCYVPRDDMEVLDEPLYANFVRVTGVDRPYREDLLSKML